jgi:hypothetical protein
MAFSGSLESASRCLPAEAGASAELRDVLPAAVRLTWDFGMAPHGGTHLLCVEQGRFSLVFQVERDTLRERGDAYARFVRRVIEAVREHFPQHDGTTRQRPG